MKIVITANKKMRTENSVFEEIGAKNGTFVRPFVDTIRIGRWIDALSQFDPRFSTRKIRSWPQTFDNAWAPQEWNFESSWGKFLRSIEVEKWIRVKKTQCVNEG